jgi:type IV pilus assembly protein PilC
LSTAIEPLMIVFIGALIGILLVAMYMPIFSAGAVVG